jgi:hypothetical protein
MMTILQAAARGLLAMALAVSLGLVGGASAAKADSITFKLRSFHKFSVDLKFFSQNRNHVWPSASTHWTIKDYEVNSYRLTCIRGEKICFGAATSGSHRMSWGVGIAGKSACKGCCHTCGGDTTTNVVNLNER